MRPIEFKCAGCGFELTEALAQRCPQCKGVLEPVYPADRDRMQKVMLRAQGDNIWVYQELLPISAKVHPVTLGEGRTPLLPAPRLAAQMGMKRLWLKLEVVNPTGSFKDRGLSVAVTYALEHGARGVIGASSGNALHAQAAYAAYSGLPSIAVVPEGVSKVRLEQPVVCGTKLVLVRGDYSQAHQLAASLVEGCSGWYNVSTTYENPVIVEGYKTVAYEIWQERKECPDLDWIVIPVGAGPLLGGCARGFFELREAGLINKMPAMLGVQAKGCAPIAKAFELGKEEVSAWKQSIATVARGVADPLRGYAQDGTYTLKWVLRSNGAIISVDDAAIKKAVKDLGYFSGVYAEPTGAVSIAGLQAALDCGLIESSAEVICLITGNGFKEENILDDGHAKSEVFPPEISVIKEAVFGGGEQSEQRRDRGPFERDRA